MNIQSLPFGLRSSFYDPTVVQNLHFWHKSWDRIISDTTFFFSFYAPQVQLSRAFTSLFR